jgi:deoxyribodipyrimidine photo-lyase
MDRAIWWIRRDLRLANNPALVNALQHSKQVIPLFILDPTLLNSRLSSPKRLAFLYSGLRALDYDLKRIGGRLVVRRGVPSNVLSLMHLEYSIDGIFAEQDFSPYARRRDSQVEASLPLTLSGSVAYRHPSDVLKNDGSPYTIFTPYKRQWLNLGLPRRSELLPAPERIATPDEIFSEQLPDPGYLLDNTPFISGEVAAHQKLDTFTDEIQGGVFDYHNLRDRMDHDGTSQLSPYLRFGMLSAEQAIVASTEATQIAQAPMGEKGVEIWLSELIWREFYISILYNFPEVLQNSFKPNFRGIRWQNDPDEFEAWKCGATGFPIVDAGMRQLAALGWMHNRARMITASFLVKDLLVDWRWGEAYFMSQLVDGDPAANNGGWQWTAGTGTDAAPYFRIFNPVLQGQKFDPRGEFIRKWVPELQAVPVEFIHQPWLMSSAIQNQVGCRIGREYPKPIIDHSVRRQMALALFGKT